MSRTIRERAPPTRLRCRALSRHPATERGTMGYLGFALTVVAAIFAYWLRSNLRWMYGLSEIGVGLLLMYLAYFPHTNNLLTEDGSWIDGFLTMPVAIFAGIYAFV